MIAMAPTSTTLPGYTRKVLTVLLIYVICNLTAAVKDSRRFGSKLNKSNNKQEDCTAKCEPSKCPNVGPIGINQCPAPYIKTYNCGCCKKCDMIPVTTTISPSRRDEVCKEVTCPKKKMCVLNIQGLPVCKCPTLELCKKYSGVAGGAKKKKVCGSDNVTYPSRCHLKVASCNSAEKKIRVVSRGECESSSRESTTTDEMNGARSLLPTLPQVGINPNSDRDANSIAEREARRKIRKEEKRKDKRLNRRKEKAYQRAISRLQE